MVLVAPPLEFEHVYMRFLPGTRAHVLLYAIVPREDWEPFQRVVGNAIKIIEATGGDTEVLDAVAQLLPASVYRAEEDGATVYTADLVLTGVNTPEMMLVAARPAAAVGPRVARAIVQAYVYACQGREESPLLDLARSIKRAEITGAATGWRLAVETGDGIRLEVPLPAEPCTREPVEPAGDEEEVDEE